MTTLEDLIRIRVMAQKLHVPYSERSYQNRMEILDHAWWIYSDYDFISRSQYFSRSPIKLLQREGALKVIINGVNRVVSRQCFGYLLNSFGQDVKDEELYQLISENSGLDKSQLNTHLSVKNSELTTRLRKEMQRWNIIKFNDAYFTKDQIISASTIKTVDIQGSILSIFIRYPLLTLSQLSLLSGLPISELHTHISRLLRKAELYRGLSRKHSPEEYFDTKSTTQDYNQEEIDWQGVPPFVLEKRDALVDILRMERGINYAEGSFWLFVDGLPQAEFDLKRKTRDAKFSVSGFRKLIQTEKEIGELIEKLEEWAENVKIRLEVNLMENPLSSFACSFVKFLVNRGYRMENTELVLHKPSNTIKSLNSVFEWDSVKDWYLRTQKFQSSELYKIIDMMISVEDVDSLAIRLERRIMDTELQSFVFTSGINNRVGYISYSNLDMVCSAYPKNPKLNEIDKHILELLDERPASPKQLSSKMNLFEKKILTRLYYLESQRLVHRTNGPFNPPLFSIWAVLNYRTEDGYSQSEALVAIILDILKFHPPLTYDQLGRFLGLTIKDLENLLYANKKKGQIVEGYFIPDQDGIQLTLPKVIDEIEEDGKEIHDVHPAIDMLQSGTELEPTESLVEEETYEEKLKRYLADIILIPQSDPIAQFLLPNFMLRTPNMAITKRLHLETKFWMILWEGHPVGYILQYPASQNLIDYDFEIKVTRGKEKIPVLSGIIERFATIAQGWNNDQLRAVSINDVSLNGRKFEPIRFLLTSMGIWMAGIDS